MSEQTTRDGLLPSLTSRLLTIVVSWVTWNSSCLILCRDENRAREDFSLVGSWATQVEPRSSHCRHDLASSEIRTHRTLRRLPALFIKTDETGMMFHVRLHSVQLFVPFRSAVRSLWGLDIADMTDFYSCL